MRAGLGYCQREETPRLLAETIKGFNGLAIQSTINNSAYYNSEENDAEIDPKSDQLVATHTSDGMKIKVTDTDNTNGNYPRKLLINRLIPDIIPVAIPPIDQTIAEDAAGSGETLHVRRTIVSKDIVTDTARSAARVFRNPAYVIRHGTDRTTQRDGNTAIGSTRLATPVWIGGSTTGSPSRNGIQYIISPRG